jgi:hypothetical protein
MINSNAVKKDMSLKLVSLEKTDTSNKDISIKETYEILNKKADKILEKLTSKKQRKILNSS